MNAHQEFGEVVQMLCTIIGIAVLATVFIIGAINAVKWALDVPATIEEVTSEQAE